MRSPRRPTPPLLAVSSLPLLLLLSAVLLGLFVRCAGDDAEHGNATVTAASADAKDSFADMIDRALEMEFPESEQNGGETDAGGFNNSVSENQTNELYQLASVAFCLLVAWCSDKLGLSLELGSFAAGVMISTTDLSQHTLEQIEPIRNFFAALFLASIGMLIHVHFLWNHVDILLAAVILVIITKTLVVTVVVKFFGYTNKTSLLVGMSLAQIGEFAFVLLSRASNLHLVGGKLYRLLLGTTARSLVTTPLLFKLIPAVIHLGVLLRWFSPDSSQGEIGFKGDSLRADSGKRITLLVQGAHDS